MEKEVYVVRNFVIVLLLLVILSFGPKLNDSSYTNEIENTVKSVSLFKDTVGIDSKKLYADFEKVNNAISAIGYPNAGYQIWEVKNEDAEFRFMIEGHWPNMEKYKEIHDHELYKKATGQESATWKALKQSWYYRFDKVK